MARILVTGSTTGLGLAAALELLDAGHRVLLHSRRPDREPDVASAAERAEAVVVGDLAEPQEVRAVAEQVNRHGRLDAVIHNAGVYVRGARSANSAGQAVTTAVNVYAPYMLSSLIERPDRLVFLSSSMQFGGRAVLDDLDWRERRWDGTQAYRDSKLLLTALTFALARRWPGVRSNAVDPGWVPTAMGGAAASDDLDLGHRTQVWLATSDQPDAAVSGAYWYHMRRRRPDPAASDEALQDRLVERLAAVTGVALAD